MMSIKEAAKVFSSAQLSAVARGDYSFVEKVSSEYLGNSLSCLSSFYDDVYKLLSKNYRAEYFFKNYLVLRRLLGRHSARTATMLTEFRVGSSKADCVILNGKSTCYEIKSEFDSLGRLRTQLQDYTKLFDEVYVVCSMKNLESVMRDAPREVGVLVLNKRNFFQAERKSLPRASSVDREMLFKSLRKNEYVELVRLLTGDMPRVANGKLFSVCFDVIKESPEDLLCKSYLDVLKKFRPLSESFLESLPTSLKSAAISYKFNSQEAKSLAKIFTEREIPCTSPS